MLHSLKSSLARLLFSFSSINSCNLMLGASSTWFMHSNSLSERDKKHDHQQQILQSIVYLSIVRREPSGKSNMFDFPDDRGSTPMAADSAVFICHKQSGTIPDRRESASAMIADELRYMKTRLKCLCYAGGLESLLSG